MQILRLVVLLLVAVVPAIFIQGCDSTSNESQPNSGVSLCVNVYETCIEPILHTNTSTGNSCSQSGCHAPPIGQGGFFLYNPASATELMTNNFPQVEARTLNNDLLQSKATGNAHGGGAQLRDNDICYNAIQEWRSITAPSDGSACMVGVLPNCDLIMANPAANVGTCG